MQQLQLAKHFKLQDELIKLDKYSLLIVDDVGYVRKTEQESSVLFERVAHHKTMTLQIFLQSHIVNGHLN